MLSSHRLWPISWSCWVVFISSPPSTLSHSPSVGGSGRRCRSSVVSRRTVGRGLSDRRLTTEKSSRAHPCELLFRRGDDLVGLEPELAQEVFERRRGAEGAHADDGTLHADIVRPAE